MLKLQQFARCIDPHTCIHSSFFHLRLGTCKCVQFLSSPQHCVGLGRRCNIACCLLPALLKMWVICQGLTAYFLGASGPKERNKHAAELQALSSSARSLPPASPAPSHPPQNSNVLLGPAATNIPIKPTLAATAGATIAAALKGSGSFMIALASDLCTRLWLLAWPLRVLMAAACAAVRMVATSFCAMVAAACWIVRMAVTSSYVMMKTFPRGVWTLVSAPSDLLAAVLPRRVAQPGPAQLELPPTKTDSSLQ